MSLTTSHLSLIPCSPEHLLCLIQQPERFAELTGFRAAEGLRSFFVSGEVSPEWLAQLGSSSSPDPWRYGFFVLERGSGTAIGTAGFKGPPDSAVRLVRAHTLPERNASTRVLEKNGFRLLGPIVDPEDGPVFRWERIVTPDS